MKFHEGLRVRHRADPTWAGTITKNSRMRGTDDDRWWYVNWDGTTGATHDPWNEHYLLPLTPLQQLAEAAE